MGKMLSYLLSEFQRIYGPHFGVPTVLVLSYL